MTDVLHEVLGQFVQVRSQYGQGEGRDEGVLEAYDERWIKLRKDAETLYFPIANVRIVKLVK